MKFSFLILLNLLFIPVFTFAQSTSTEAYFCTDESINLIYYSVNNTRSLYLTSFTNDNKIHIANSYRNDTRNEGDNPINIQSNSSARRNLERAPRDHTSINNFAKLITSYNYNASTSFGFLYQKDKVKITLRRVLDNTLLTSKTFRFQDSSNYIYISPRQILGRGYNCGRGVKLIIERINQPPVVNRVNFDYDLNRRELLISIDVDEPLNLLSLKITGRTSNQVFFEYSSTTDGQQTSFVVPASLTNIPPQQRLTLSLRIRDLENAEASTRITFNTPGYNFNNPVLNDVVIKRVSANRAEIWVLTSKIRDLRREIGTRSTINYGTGTNLNQTNTSEVNKVCLVNTIRYDCAQHNLTGLSPNTGYNFYVALVNEAGLTTTSTIRSFTTLASTLPAVSNLRANFLSSQATGTYLLIDISGKIIDDNPPFDVRATLSGENIPVNLRNQTFSLRLRNVNISTTSELVISIKNNLNLERILRFLLPDLD